MNDRRVNQKRGFTYLGDRTPALKPSHWSLGDRGLPRQGMVVRETTGENHFHLETETSHVRGWLTDNR